MILNDINVIGKGTFGCIYEGNKFNKTKKLIKLTKHKNSWYREINFLRKIKKILEPNSSITNESEEKILLKNKNKYITVLDKCGLNYDNIDTIYQIIYHYSKIGISLTKNKNYLDIIKLSKDLYNTLEIYKKYNLLHNDIKPDNIIYISKLNKLYFIDFGLSIDYSIINFFSIYKTGTYNYYSPEKILYNEQNISLKKFITDFLSNFRKKYPYIFRYYSEAEMEEDLKELYTLYNNNKQEYYNKDNIAKIDSYALSLTLFRYYLRMNKNNINIEFINNILLPGIKFDIKKRLKIEDICKRFF
jgi:serine/threonine protein kinase